MARTLNGLSVKDLHKRLAKLIEDGHGSKRVHVDLDSFRNNIDATICQIHGVGFVTVQMLDDDGGSKIDSKGRHVEESLLTLVGASRANAKGEIVDF